MPSALVQFFALGLLAGSALAVPMPDNGVLPGVSGPTVIGGAPIEFVTADGKAGTQLFSYHGNDGPRLWPGSCQDVAGQSPIDLRPGSADRNPGQLAVKIQALTSVTMEHNGNGIKLTPAASAAPITFVPLGQQGGAQEVFTMTQFHIHTPGEHTLNGKFFDGELHMVFKSPTEKIAVVSTFLQVCTAATTDPMLSLIEKSLPLNGGSVEIPNFDLNGIAAAANQFTGFFTYTGSLTAPPCSPNVLWHIMETPVDIPVSLTLAMRNEQGMNARGSQVARDEVPSFNGGLLSGAAKSAATAPRSG